MYHYKVTGEHLFRFELAIEKKESEYTLFAHALNLNMRDSDLFAACITPAPVGVCELS